MAKKISITKEQFNKICEGLETSHKGLLHFCQLQGFKSETPFRNLKKDNEELEKRYARAREMQLDYLGDLLIELSFDGSGDREVNQGVNVGSNSIARDRLKADTLKFVLAKLKANVYGAKVEVTNIEKPIFNGIDLDVEE